MRLPRPSGRCAGFALALVGCSNPTPTPSSPGPAASERPPVASERPPLTSAPGPVWQSVAPPASAVSGLHPGPVAPGPPSAGAVQAEPAPTPVAPAAPSGASLAFVAEPPFRLFERPRPPGAVHAAVLDETLARWNVGGTGDPSYISNRPGYHPGARVVVDAKVLSGNLPKRGRRGVLSEQSVLAEARKRGYWPYRLCFEDGLRLDQKLSGQTIVRLSIGSSGRVVATRLVQTKLKDENVARCLAERTGDLEFAPRPSRRVDVELSIKLWPGDAPVALVGPPDGTPFDNPGILDSEAAARALAQCEPSLRACYQQGVERDAELWGRIQFRIDQAADGRVQKVAEDESRFPDRQVVDCMVNVIQTQPLPAPKGGELTFVFAVRLGSMPAPL